MFTWALETLTVSHIHQCTHAFIPLSPVHHTYSNACIWHCQGLTHAISWVGIDLLIILTNMTLWVVCVRKVWVHLKTDATQAKWRLGWSTSWRVNNEKRWKVSCSGCCWKTVEDCCVSLYFVWLLVCSKTVDRIRESVSWNINDQHSHRRYCQFICSVTDKKSLLKVKWRKVNFYTDTRNIILPMVQCKINLSTAVQRIKWRH